MTQAGQYTLTEITEEYLAERQIDKKKYFAGYLIHAKISWRRIFTRTIFSVQSQWEPLMNDGTNYYINVPTGLSRLFSISEKNHCGEIVPLYYNEVMNAIPMPEHKACNCGNCACNDACELVNGVTLTTRVLFTINNIDYIEKTWTRVCPNGDVIEYREIPTKKYNDTIGDSGDYNPDYNNDYLIGNPPFSNFTIVNEVKQNIICKMEVAPCGCIIDNDSNIENFNKIVGFNTEWWGKCGNGKKCESKGNINNNERGEVKASPCGTKILYFPSKHHHHNEHKKLPEFLLVNFQTSGDNCNSQVLVPSYAVDCMKYGIDYHYKRFNNSFSRFDKKAAEYSFVDAENEVIRFLNPISLDFLAQVQDAKILF